MFFFLYPIFSAMLGLWRYKHMNERAAKHSEKLVGLESWDILSSFNSNSFMFLPEKVLNVLEKGE